MNPPAALAPHWNAIDTVLLDMDGTLLDKHFDDHFWEEYVPQKFAEANDLCARQARTELLARFQSIEGTLNWTNLDFWSGQLGLDIPFLKTQVDHLIDVHPFVVPFLDRVKEVGKSLVLVTNAHGKTLDLKMEKTALAGKFDQIFTSHDLGAPKEDQAFWETLSGELDFSPERTLLGEDTEACLVSAARFGIRYLVFVSRSSSAKPASTSNEFFNIETFKEIMP
jgi:putative hydrolase of the HAD superfamily